MLWYNRSMANTENQSGQSLTAAILDKTLQELEGNDWGEPTFSSHLVTECHRLRRVPLRDFTIEDLRIMIGQNISLDYLVPLALDQLEANPLAEGDFYEGDFYEGDLLWYVNRIPAEFWNTHPGLYLRWQGIVESVGGPFNDV